MDDPSERIQIRIDANGTEAWVTVLAGLELSKRDLQDRLNAAGIVSGIDPQSIEAITRSLDKPGAMTSEVCVAKGLAPEAGTPPTLQLQAPTGPVAGVLRNDGRLDFRERLSIVPVMEGETIGQIIQGIEGKPGRDVFGEAIAPEPLPECTIKHGDGIAINEEQLLIATRSGARTIESNDTLDVVDHHIHSGSVDLKSGNLQTEGSLEISRDVTNGMCVRTTADLNIGGMVDGGRVDAGGSIEIKGGAIGRRNGVVFAGGDLVLRHALGIRLYSKGRLIVARSVSTSHLVAHEVEVQGRLLSDSVQAESKLILQDVGSKTGGPCVLRAAYPLDFKIRDSASDPLRKPTREKKTSRQLRSLKDRKGKSSRKSRDNRSTAPNKREALEARRKWRCRQRELQMTAVIEIAGTIRAGCRIDFGVAPLVLEENLGPTRFSVDPKTNKIITEAIQ